MKKAFTHFLALLFAVILTSETSKAQSVFYFDQFNGGVATGAFSIGIAANGSGSFTINIPAGSSIHQAWFFATRTGANAPPVTVQLNSTNYLFDLSNQVGTGYFTPFYGGASAVHAIDVTSAILPSTINYTITVPPQFSVADKFTEFYLYIAYDNPSLPQVTSYIYLNEVDCAAVMNYTLSTSIPISTVNPVGFAICGGYAADLTVPTDCEEVNVNGTSLGTFYGADFNAASIFGSTGTFEYYNNTLNGLGDDDANQAILGPDVLSDIKNLIPNNATSFPVTLTHCPGASLEDNMIWMFFLTYSSDTCGASGLNLGNDTTLCPGSFITLVATTPNATYTWQDGSTDPTFVVTQPGVYTVNVDVNGCQFNDTISITGLPLPVVELGNDTAFCQGQTLTLDVTIPNGTYLWQDGSSSPVFTISQSGTYLVNVTNSCGTVSDSIQVVVNSIPVVNLGNDTTICAGQSVLLDASLLNASYVWQDGSANATFNVTQTGNYFVDVTVNGCSSSDSILVTVNPLPVVSLGNDSTLCQGQTITLNAGTPNATYLWNDNSTAATLVASQTGLYYCQVTVNGCSSSDSVSLVFNAIPVVDLGNDTSLCAGQTVLLDATTNGGAYLWNDNSVNSTLLVSTSGNYSVQVTVNGCTGYDTTTVTFIALPVVNLGNDVNLCEGQNVTLDATASNASYLWSNNSVTPSITVSQTGTYWVEVTVNGCSGRDTVNVNVTALPVVDLGANSLNCEGDVVVLDASTSGGTYLWQNNSTNPTLTVGQTGTYWVQVSVNGCDGSDTVAVAFENCEVILEVPNIITPNNDGLNDYFIPLISKGVVTMKTTIFNRWGTEVFSTDRLLIEWNGNSGSTDIVDGVYFYVIEFIDKKGNKDTRKGTLTLIR